MQDTKRNIGFLSSFDYNLYLFRLPIMIKMVEKGWKVYAICPNGKVSSKFNNYGIEHININLKRKSLNPFYDVYTIYKLYKILNRLNIDILNTFTSKPNIYGTFAGRLSKTPIIINLVEGLGSFYIEDNKKAKLIKKIIEILYALIFRLSNKVIVINPDDMFYLINKRILQEKKAFLIKGVGVDTNEYSRENIDYKIIKNLEKDLNLNHNQIIVLMVSRLLIHKGVLEYIKAAEILKEKYKKNVEFLLVGDFDPGNLYNVSKDILDSYLKKGVIKFLGWRDDIKELLALCDIYVLPSYREGIPRTILEAESMGKPIVTTNTIGCKEVVENEKNGYLVPIKDVQALSDAIEKLILDSDLREKYGNYSRQKAVNEYDIKIIIGKYMELYNILLNETL
jgi:N,N'-diacetylbacillosaminyl-diphospho-undecaprenol alpha-1,3-N-acetylgalactosaminyltransferase